jgi:hypothetical protein
MKNTILENTIKSLPKFPLVKFNFSEIPIEYHKAYPFSYNDDFLFLGEITQMPGHCLVMNHRTGQLYSGYHSDNFILIPDEDC